jgi:hypothetical protein
VTAMNKTTLWELRFTDGRGASFFTTADVSEDIGRLGLVRTIPAAAQVSQARALHDARKCFEEGRVVELIAHMGAVAYGLRHELPTPEVDG